MFSNIKLSNKITGVIAFIILGMLFISTSSYMGFTKVGSEIEEIAEYQIPLIKVITELEKDILQEEILTYALILASKNVHGSKFLDMEQEIAKLQIETEKKIKQCEVLAQKAIDHAHEINIQEKYQLFLDSCKVLEKEQYEFNNTLKEFEHDLETGNLSNIENEKALLHKELSSMEEHAVKLAHQITDLLEESTLQAEHDEKIALLTIEIVSLLVLVCSILLGLGLVKNIRENMHDFQVGLLGFFTYLNRESLNVKLLEAKNKDEFGVMSKLINDNITKTQTIIEEDRAVINDTIVVLNEFEQGDLSKRVLSTTHNPCLHELITLLNQMGDNLEKNINSVLHTLGEYSNSNYMNKVKTTDIKKHLLLLANGVNTLGEATTVMLIDSKTNGVILDESSNILLKNVSLLNKNSNESAVALEETAAALEEITTNISSSTTKISKMSEFAAALSNSANEGEDLASKTTTSMDEINTEVNSISEAITIIDQIAFQTNILSLNAAVEAATAGEAGKGFAVVAQEVRSLASRSAEAANEIKALVENARKKANNGKDTADKMIVGYTGLHENIAKTIELITEIEISSKEQFLGIEQINDAVTTLDRQTQENAVIASETHDVALQTDTIAKLVVSDANKKEFIGKEEVNRKNKLDLEHRGNEQRHRETLIRESLANSKNKANQLETIKDKEKKDDWSSF